MKSRLINEHSEFLKENIQHIYNCNKKILYPPKNFITYNIITDENDKYKNEVKVDECLSNEIEELWSQGIKTTGCCCGHGYMLGFIEVTDDCIEEMEKLISDLGNCNNPYHCTHGRPTIITFSIYELEKLFKRSI